MKKNLLLLIPALALVFFVTSCSKSDTTPPANSTPSGKWSGWFTPNLGPSRYFALTFSANGAIAVEANSSTTPDIATGTWALVADSVRATYTYISGATTGTYSLAGKFSSQSSIMNGTVGTASSTTGTGTFTLTKQ